MPRANKNLPPYSPEDFLKPIKYEQLVLHAKNKLLFFLCEEFFTEKFKHNSVFSNRNARKGKKTGINMDKQMSWRNETNVKAKTESL